MNVNNFQSAYVLWYKKSGFLKDEEEENPLFEWGHRLEPALAQKFADNHPEFAVHVTGSWIHQDRPWHGANPDRLLSPVYDYYDPESDSQIVLDELPPEAVLEIKTSMNGYGWENDLCPIKYVAQLRWYLECFGFEYGYLIVLASLGDYREFMIPRDPNKPVISMQTGAEEWYSIGGEEMIEAGAQFWQSILDGVPPEPDGGKDTYELIKTFHPDVVDKDVEVTLEQAQELWDAKLASEDAEAEYRRMKSVYLDIIGKNRRAVIPAPPGTKQKPTVVARRQSTGGSAPFLVVV